MLNSQKYFFAYYCYQYCRY